MTETKQQCMRPSDLAKHWDCSENHVRNLIKRGDLRAFRLGERLWRIPADAVTEFEQRQEELLAAETAAQSPDEGTYDPPFSSRGLASRWGCSDQHIRDLIKQDVLPHFWVGRHIRIPASAVRAHEDCGDQF